MVNVKYQIGCNICKTIETRSDNKWYTCKKCKEKIKRSNESIEQAKATKYASPVIGYKFELFKISKETLTKFILLENKRKLSKSQILSLYNCLYNKNHFDSPIVVNEVRGSLRIIDGNHRIEAIKKMLNNYQNYTINVLLIVYSNLTEDEEIACFRKWNVGKAQSLDDFIQSIAKKVPIIKWINNKFPVEVSVYKKPDSITIRNLCGAYLAAKYAEKSGYALKRDNFAKELYAMEEKDYQEMFDFVKKFRVLFNEPSQKNPYYKQTFFYSLFYTYFMLRETKEFKDSFFQKVQENLLGDEEVLKINKFTGRMANEQMIDLMKIRLKVHSVLPPAGQNI